MLKMLTKRNMAGGVDEDLAASDARLEYTETYGPEVIESEDVE